MCPADVDRLTLSEIAVMREALHDRYRAESGKGPAGSVENGSGYVAWLHSLTPLEKARRIRDGTL